MEKLKLVLPFVALCLFCLTGPGYAQERIRVRCHRGETVQQAVNRAQTGDVIVVVGVCQENVNIPSSRPGIRIVGAAADAGITGVDANQAVINLDSAPGIVIQGLTIRGPGISEPGTGFGGPGIRMVDGASAHIVNCIIENHRVQGIEVNTSSAVISGNVIRGNNLSNLDGLGGVTVLFNGTAKLFNNLIEANQKQGLVLRDQSYAFVFANTIQNSVGDGVSVRVMSLVSFPTAGGTTILNNTGFGLVCDEESRFLGLPSQDFVASGNASGDIRCTHVK
jgi:parallel beta helix pectate lyase-like protein